MDCSVQLEITTHEEACIQFGGICGVVAKVDDEPIAGTNVRLSGIIVAEEVTLVDGQFCFEDVQLEQVYKLRPSKDDRHSNGVSTFDIVLISRHIIGMNPLDSPYKIIAADVNRSNTVTTLDIVKIRRLILGIDDRFPESASWRFIPANHVFTNQEQPFLDPIPEELIFTLTDADTTFNFVGIKVGDVNFNALPN
ncbi:MAG: hypothetical protein F6K19_39035 [Cyanothece sp. SIO1E1]|nr:hypothetical protein [Cyanothece sp. SIO1E1]